MGSIIDTIKGILQPVIDTIMGLIGGGDGGFSLDSITGLLGGLF